MGRTYSAGSMRARRFPSSARGLRRARFLFKVGFTVPAPRDARAPPSRLLLRHAVGEVARPSRGRTSSFRARTCPLPRVSTPKFRAGSGARIWIRSKFRSGLPSFITFHFLFTFLAVLAIDEQLFRASCAGQYRPRAWLP